MWVELQCCTNQVKHCKPASLSSRMLAAAWDCVLVQCSVLSLHSRPRQSVTDQLSQQAGPPHSLMGPKYTTWPRTSIMRRSNRLKQYWVGECCTGRGAQGSHACNHQACTSQ
jgi:hypothetical protein